MTLVGFKGSNHPQQVTKRGASDEVDDRGTHPNDFDPLDARFGGFTLDAAAAPHNAKCAKYFTRADDGLVQSWAGERVWCNPPYSKIGDWVMKAHNEAPHTRGIVMLLPANRTEQGWWQDWVEPFRHEGDFRHDRNFRVEFLRGRMRFIKAGQTAIGPNERPPFGCCLLIWKGKS